MAGVMMVSACVLGMLPPSRASIERQKEREQTAATSRELNRQLEEHVEELLQEADEEELEQIDASKLRELVKKLEKKEDLQEAMRQYAVFAQKLAEKAKQLRRKDDERLLSRAAEELKKDAETAELGRKLARKKYKEAGCDLEELQHKAKANLEANRHRYDRLKKASTGLANAAQRCGGLRKQGDWPLADRIGAVDRDLKRYEESLQECEKCKCNNGQCSRKARSCLNKRGRKCNSSLCKLGRSMKKLDAACRACRRLEMLRRKLSQCQSCVAGRCRSPFVRKGGKKAGEGTVDSKNDEQTPSEGRLTKLEGTLGEGPSQVTIEDADSGTGVSRLRSESREVSHRQQLESFVEREDIPRPLKAGVRQYFENIHENEE